MPQRYTILSIPLCSTRRFRGKSSSKAPVYGQNFFEKSSERKSWVNIKGKQGGYAEFDNFTVDEPCADRSANIPYGKTIRIINKATGRPAIALKHGLLYDTHAGDKSQLAQFKVIDRGQGRVALQCADGRYVKVYGDGLPGDVRFTTDLQEAEQLLWQDYLDHDSLEHLFHSVERFGNTAFSVSLERNYEK